MKPWDYGFIVIVLKHLVRFELRLGSRAVMILDPVNYARTFISHLTFVV
jgi:hypothetical protein